MNRISPRPVDKLIQALSNTNTSNRYAFFLGAGCSISSGVRSAQSLIEEWRAQKYLLEVEMASLDHTKEECRFLVEYCSERGPHLGRDEEKLSDYKYIEIYPKEQYAALSDEILSALGENEFVDKRHIGGSSALTGTKKTHLFEKYGATQFSIKEALKIGDDFYKWLSIQSWYNTPSEYSELFQDLYELPAQRQAFIEKEVEFARPYWGYLYLANMMSIDYFDVCFTTNFDDLLNDAFISFTADKKPIVCSHDSQVSGIRLMSKRPKIIKLHGDFLYESLKNTQQELRSLSKNMENKLRQFSKELGLIVVGYGGNDLSIISILVELLKESDSFPNGIHWCILKGEKPGQKVTDLLQFERVLLYEIENFDYLMADLYQALRLDTPQFAKNPILLMADQLDICGSIVLDDDPHPMINEHISELNTSLKKLIS